MKFPRPLFVPVPVWGPDGREALERGEERLRAMRESAGWGNPCVAWTGHNYEVMGKEIVCTHCSDSREMKTKFTRCTNFHGHLRKNIQMDNGKIFIWCRVCGDSKAF